MSSKEAPVIVRSDSRTLVLALKSRVPVKGRSLRIDIAALKEIVSKGEVVVLWVSKGDQIADVMTKEGVSKKRLREYIYMFMERVDEKWGEE